MNTLMIFVNERFKKKYSLIRLIYDNFDNIFYFLYKCCENFIKISF